MEHSLKGRNAIVTGGARGLGLAIAQRLLQAGARVSIFDVQPDARGSVSGALAQFGDVEYLVCDQADPAAVSAAVAESVRRMGTIDILVNNAGIIGPTANVWEYPVADWQRVLDVDLSGVFYCCREVVPHMLERQYGRIVNVASIAGKEGNPKLSGYSVAKAGVIALTKSLGKELATSGILVNAIAPAVISTEMNKQVPPELTAALVAKIPMGRLGEPVEVAELVYWLSSDANSFSTGAVFDLSGGRATY